MFFKSENVLQIRKSFSNPKMSTAEKCQGNWARIEHSEQHGWILFELKVLYFLDVFWSRSQYLYTVGFETNQYLKRKWRDEA